MTIEGSCNIHMFEVLAAYFAKKLHFDTTSLFLLILTHHKPKVWELLEVHLLSFQCHIYIELRIVTKFYDLISIICILGAQ
jgi:hypothetical protein